MAINSPLLPMTIALSPSFQVIDPRFRSLVFPNVHVDKLHTGSRWAEGPVWFAAGRYLLWSDIPNDRVLRWDEPSNAVSVFSQPAMNSNGHTVDMQGRLITCEHRGRCVSRTEHDGSHKVLASHVNGRRLNSPNDVVVKSDGSIWFTDPSYGIDSDYEGDTAAGEIGECCVYRIDADDGSVTRVANGFVQPNGLAFSPDEALLYVSDSGASHVTDGPRHIRRFSVGTDSRSLQGGSVFAQGSSGLFDGLRIDTRGNIWTSAGDGVHVYAPEGTLLGKILLPETTANVCFGGAKLNRLFICATTSLYAVYVNARGATPGQSGRTART